MKNKLTTLVLSATKINRQHVQLVLMIVSLAMLVLGVGAPVDGGGGR
jgi:succinate-acetate transporter protein